jgi:hypothetical protein
MTSLEAIAPLFYGLMWTFLCVLSRIGPMLVIMTPLKGS